MILSALAKTDRIRGHLSIKTQCTTIIFIRLLPPTTLLPRGETIFHLPLINILEIFKDFSSTTRKYSKTVHQQPENIQRLLINNPKIFKDFSSTTRKYSKTFHQQPENIQRPLRLQNCRSRRSSKSWKHSGTFRPAKSN